jgi:hypothetical protein
VLLTLVKEFFSQSRFGGLEWIARNSDFLLDSGGGDDHCAPKVPQRYWGVSKFSVKRMPSSERDLQKDEGSEDCYSKHRFSPLSSVDSLLLPTPSGRARYRVLLLARLNLGFYNGPVDTKELTNDT